MSVFVETAFLDCIGHITGLREGGTPLGGWKIENGGPETQCIISDFFKTVVSKMETNSSNPLLPIFNEVKQAFINTYSRENKVFLKERLSILRTAKDPNVRAKAAAEIWAPEIAMPDETIFAKWQLSGVTANPITNSGGCRSVCSGVSVLRTPSHLTDNRTAAMVVRSRSAGVVDGSTSVRSKSVVLIEVSLVTVFSCWMDPD